MLPIPHMSVADSALACAMSVNWPRVPQPPLGTIFQAEPSQCSTFAFRKVTAQMSLAETALAPVIQLCIPGGSCAECHRPLLRSSITGRPGPAKFEPPKNQPVRPVTSTSVYWLRLLSGGTYLVASRSVQDFVAVRGPGADASAGTDAVTTAAVAITPPTTIRRGRIGASGFSNGGVGSTCRGKTSQIPVVQVVVANRQWQRT